MKCNRGFTLIEVLVASVVLVALLSALLPLFDQSNLSTQKAIESNAKVALERNIFNSIKTINPHQESRGRGQVGRTHYTWASKAITPEVPVRLDKISVGRDRIIRLYLVTVNVSPAEETRFKPWQFQFEQIGWES
ncbi:prepilin-type N-terminal cleavage/methylation domain-containing protein [Motilimonas pumila]|uniref:Prepilin-type N-terminal cleavage/methylation domain-containing protein n=1 Tax=Motilimonas pumila TaxID=2303987 RepID=A0A418YDV7_9GAMM|nr:prepilin-type N-terminal cleavage/methylation domain-containing protein [Motilimonas pumila]RJG42727.1 prepilin-type N-terminal cleavage/methylation domain-containing protein [Motilimonas pumila]